MTLKSAKNSQPVSWVACSFSAMSSANIFRNCCLSSSYSALFPLSSLQKVIAEKLVATLVIGIKGARIWHSTRARTSLNEALMDLNR